MIMNQKVSKLCMCAAQSAAQSVLQTKQEDVDHGRSTRVQNQDYQALYYNDHHHQWFCIFQRKANDVCNEALFVIYGGLSSVSRTIECSTDVN